MTNPFHVWIDAHPALFLSALLSVVAFWGWLEYRANAARKADDRRR